MPIYCWILCGIGCALLSLFILLFIRALLFKPAKIPEAKAEPVSIDQEKAVCSLQTLICCRTVSNLDPSKEDEKEFDKLKTALRSLYVVMS